MKLRLEPNETREIQKAGYSFYVQSVGTGADAEIEVNIDNETEILRAGEGIPSNGVMFHSVRVTNLESIPVMLDYAIAANNRGLISNRLAGIVSVDGLVNIDGTVNVDGVVETASDFSRSIRGESLQMFAEEFAASGLYSVVQFENPIDSGKKWVIQNIEGSTANLSLEAAVQTPLQVGNQTYAYASNKLQGQARPYVNIYKGPKSAGPVPVRTHFFVTSDRSPIVVSPGGVMTFSMGNPNTAIGIGIDFIEVPE